MEIYVITPIDNLPISNLGNRFFCLAQWFRRSTPYGNWYKEKVNQGRWVTLDNGVGDHDAINADKLYDTMLKLMPSEVIALDVLNDKQATIDNAIELINRMYEDDLLDSIEIMFVPQGNSMEEWLECYMWALQEPSITTIGMSKLAIPHCFLGQTDKDQNIMEARHMCFDILLENGLIQKPLHFLGAQDPREFLKYKDNPLCRSTDSCFSVLAGMKGILWDQGNFERVPTPDGYFTMPMIKDHMIAATRNINYFKELLGIEIKY